MNCPAPPSPDHLFAPLSALGLNLQAVFDIDRLPASLRAGVSAALPPGLAARQLILIANAGRALWAQVVAAGGGGEDPIDAFSRQAVEDWLARALPGQKYCLLYPGDCALDLQALGRLAGWHHPTPFKVGIQRGWGSWFGYRVLLAADSALPVSVVQDTAPPCEDCARAPCVPACPAQAMDGGAFDLQACLAWRLRPDSSCRFRCLAREACPLGRQHRYDDEQMRHIYAQSLRMIEGHARSPAA